MIYRILFLKYNLCHKGDGMADTKRLNIPIEAELHKQLKVKVAEKGETVAQFVRDAIAEKIERENAKGE